MSLSKLRKTALAACIGFAGIGSANAAFILNDNTVDGAWLNTAQGGRGADLDYIARGNGNGTLFIAVYSYDAAGNPLWLATSVDVTEGDFTKTGVPLYRFSGGSFGTNFTAPTRGEPALATVAFTFNSCNELKLDITPTAASGLPVSNLTLAKAESLAGSTPSECVYSQAFTACPAGTTALAGSARTCELTGTITSNVRLSNNATYILNGKVQVGTASPTAGGAGTPTGTLTIEPGTLIKGKGTTSDYLVVNPGSKIFAEGTPYAPIVFTGPTETSGSWAGIFLAGLAPVNRGASAGAAIAFEADPNIVFGGNAAGDSSGAFRYVQIRHAGKTIGANRELNCLTLGGVGSGTAIDHVQCHNGTDDAFEFFGGTVNAKYLVATGNDDDNLDMDYGYVGKLQYVYVKPDGQVDTADGRCVESDNTDATGNQDSTPRTQPKIANLTCLGASTGSTWFEGMRLRRGSAGNYFNAVFANATDACLRFNDNSTYNAAPNATAPVATTMSGGFVSCTTNFKDGADSPYTVSTWFNGQAGNATGTAAAALNGRFAVASGPLDGTGVAVPNDAFFDRTSYKGAFGPAGGFDWAQGWTLPGSL